MAKLTRQLCMILALGLVIGVPGLASVSYADLLGPTFSSYISFYSPGEPWNQGEVRSSSEGTIFHNDSLVNSVVTITPTSIYVNNTDVGNPMFIYTAGLYASNGQLSWSRPGWPAPPSADTIVNLSFDCTIFLDQRVEIGNGWGTFVDVAYNTNAGTFHYGETGTYHFAQTFSFTDPVGGSLFVQARAIGAGQANISNLSISFSESAVPLPGALLLLGSGLLRLANYRRRKLASGN